MKRILVFVLTASLCVSMAACSSSSPSAPGGTESASSEAGGAEPGSGDTQTPADPDMAELTVWCWTQDFNLYAIREANKIYAADHPDINVTPIEVPWDDVQSKLITALSAKQYDALPDIVLMQDNAAQKNIMTYPDAFFDMTDLVDFSSFAPYKVGNFTVNGRIYGMPFDSGVCCTFLRRDILEEAGYTIEDFNDITWDQYIEMGAGIKEKTGKSIISIQDGSLDIPTMILQSSGEWYFGDDGALNMSGNKSLRAAIDVTKRMMDAGIVMNVVDWNEYTSSLVNGDVASCVNAVWMVSILTAAEDQSGLWGAASFPRLANTPDAKNSSSNGGSSWMVIASSKNAETAVDFLDKTFNGSVEFYETILETSGAIATWLPAAQSPIYSEPVEFFGGQKVYADIIDWSGDVPPITTGMYMYEAQDAVTKAYQDILGGADVDAALQTAEDTVSFLMEQ